MDMPELELPSTRTRRLILIAMLALAAALFAVAVIIFRANPSTTSLPVAIQSVSPEPSSNVLLQSDVVVDLAVGYTGAIDINGIPIPPEQLTETAALNQFRFKPGADKVLDRLFQERNCVRVEYWLIAEGPTGSQTFTWCFDAS